ncbi:MAG: hypothetical protein IE916_00555 [Epsilonproteobacteria bacterium]|nr:hypothetical protein [Campylobacterota bacterium]
MNDTERRRAESLLDVVSLLEFVADNLKDISKGPVNAMKATELTLKNIDIAANELISTLKEREASIRKKERSIFIPEDDFENLVSKLNEVRNILDKEKDNSIPLSIKELSQKQAEMSEVFGDLKKTLIEEIAKLKTQQTNSYQKTTKKSIEPKKYSEMGIVGGLCFVGGIAVGILSVLLYISQSY